MIARMASSTDTPRAARSSTWSAYTSASATAFAKIVGLEVTPTPCELSISLARLPLFSRPREMSSSHTETPWSESAWSRSFICVPSVCEGSVHCGRREDAVLRGLGHGLGGHAELGVEPLVVGGGAEMLDRHAAPVVA